MVESQVRNLDLLKMSSRRRFFFIQSRVGTYLILNALNFWKFDRLKTRMVFENYSVTLCGAITGIKFLNG